MSQISSEQYLELLLRTTALENLLITKGILTVEEIRTCMEEISSNAMKAIEEARKP